MKRETEISLAATENVNQKYDEACKLVFQNKEIIAPILQQLVPEYRKCTVEEVISYIDNKSVQNDPVDDVSIRAMATEMTSVSEKLIRYDVRFKALNPLLSNKKIKFYLHIDLEIQNDYHPSHPKYPIVKRGIYYAAREISSQLGILTETTNYNKLEKVYSIWICNENIPKKLQNTVTSYKITKNDIIGSTNEKCADYDLMDVIIVRRGQEHADGIFDYLFGVFESDIEKISKYVNIEDKKEIMGEVTKMTGLGDGIFQKGVKQGVQQGLQEGLQEGLQLGIQQEREEGNKRIYSLVSRKELTASAAANCLGISEEELKRNMILTGYAFPEEV